MSYIYKLVFELAARYGTRNPYELAEELGIMILYYDLGKMRGCFTYIDGQPVIMINERLNEHAALIVCAHELGHFVLHSDIAKEAALRDFHVFNMQCKTEYEANVFAAHLLIDEDRMFELLRAGYTAERTASILETSPVLLNIMFTSLNSMGYKLSTSWNGTTLF